MDLSFLAPVGAVIALLFAFYNAMKVKKADEGSEKVRELSKSISQGANAYLKRQYKTVIIFFFHKIPLINAFFSRSFVY